MVDLRTFHGAAMRPWLTDLARLRVEVFRAFPYLYDGDESYEREYLAHFADSPDALLVGAFDRERMVGAATGSPMEAHAEDFAVALEPTDLSADAVYYCAESVLLPAFRGQGLGHRFFDLREAAARALGRAHVAFCAVIRPANHPARPVDYAPLDPFWRKRGYAPIPGAIAHFAWQDVGETGQTEKPLQMWIRSL